MMLSFILNNLKLVIDDFLNNKIKVIDFENKYQVEIIEGAQPEDYIRELRGYNS